MLMLQKELPKTVWLKTKEEIFNHNINKLILLLRKVVYEYEYRDDWKKLNETSLPTKEDFYSHPEKVCIDFRIKN